MSKIAISPNVNGNGTFTLAAPDSNTNRTLTLPDAGGEVLTNASAIAAANITGNVAAARITTALNATGSAPIFACRAWVNFNGSGTVAIRGSGNVSSITDEGTGQYRVNFATAMPDANYSAPMSSSENATTTTQGNVEGHGKTTTLTTTSCRVITKFHVTNIANRAHDSALVSVVIFR